MKIKAFRKLYTSIYELDDELTNWSNGSNQHKENSVFTNAIFETNGNIISSIAIAFVDELDINILKSPTNKIDIIKFYLYDLKDRNRFFNNPQYQKIICQFGIYDNSFSKIENLIIAIHYIYVFITTEIQYCCIKYDIDFISICKEVDFDCSSINNIYRLTVEPKKEVKKKKLIKNPFPQIFNCDDNRAYNVFKEWAEGHTDKWTDYSFIFQKMISEKENLIRKKFPHLSFMLFLKDNDFLNKREYEDFTKKGSFSSKADSAVRLTRYYKIKEKYYPSDSDKSE